MSWDLKFNVRLLNMGHDWWHQSHTDDSYVLQEFGTCTIHIKGTLPTSIRHRSTSIGKTWHRLNMRQHQSTSLYSHSNIKYTCTLILNQPIWLCDVIKQNESELANIDFKIQSIITSNFLCIFMFWAALKCWYLLNQKSNFDGGFT